MMKGGEQEVQVALSGRGSLAPAMSSARRPPSRGEGLTEDERARSAREALDSACSSH